MKVQVANYVYISGALTGLPPDVAQDTQVFYEKLAAVCEEVGLGSYVPHQHSAPGSRHMNEEIDFIDRSAVMGALLVVAVLDHRSFGTGIEIEMANHAFKTVIAVFREDQTISRLVLGNPAVRHAIIYSDQDDACRQLASLLERLVVERNTMLPEVLCRKITTFTPS